MKKRVIFVMNRWDSSKGGIQTVNRELMLALARSRTDLDCVAVVTTAEKAEVEQAYLNGVTLIHGERADDWTPVLMSEELRAIDKASVLAVVGHSSFSGVAASELRRFWFPDACAVQFIHMDPMRTEAVKEDKKDKFVAAREEKLKAELEIAKIADIVFCVGPRLFRVTRDMFLAHGLERGHVYRIDCGMFPDQQIRDAPPEQPTVVCLGRTESTEVKGLDIFAYTAGMIDQQWATSPLTKGKHIRPRYIVRGAEDNPEELQAKMKTWAAEVGGTPEIVVRPYTTSKADLSADLRGATAFLMPSREEGFGLVACEAMSFGAPIIVSQQSGIAELILETAQQTGQNFSRCVVEMSGDPKDIAARFASAALPLLVEGAGDELLYPRLRGYLASVCSWDKAATTFMEVVEAASQARSAASTSSATSEPAVSGSGPLPATSSAPATIENVLAAEREGLMAKQGVIAVGIKQAIVVTVEKGYKPNLPDKLDGFEVVVREVEEVKLTSTEPSSGHELFVNGERRATVGLFGIDSAGKLFAITVAHAFPGSFHDMIEIQVDGRRIPATLDILEEHTDWAILRLDTGDLPVTHRPSAYRRPGAKAFIEMPGKQIEGTVDSVDMTMDFAVGDAEIGKRRYEDVFEVALDSGVGRGASGAVVSDEQGEMLGVVVGAMVKEGGAMSVLARDASAVLERNKLLPVTIDDMGTQPHICILLDSDEAASAVFGKLARVSRFTRSGRLYFRGRTYTGARLTCTILRELGSVASAIAMTSMLIDNKPDVVFIVGRCAGLRPGQEVGDVVISSEVLAFEPNLSGLDIRHFRPHVSVTPMVLQNLGYQLAAQGRLGRVHVGPLASVSMVREMSDVGALETISRSLAALDVGAAGAVRAANAISSELPVVVVSVIADLLHEGKVDRPDVAYQAASVVLEMISHIKVQARARRRNLIIGEPAMY
ncbi:glycosyltransferase [Mesorhizobium sp.]|uniref:glycosyltransferase n=2 Tax=unclassified Mesorhizobium TaxID=325217 RepID=UPI0025CC66AE|nr:glycosyltransferase [Mesorhizobium sp.]